MKKRILMTLLACVLACTAAFALTGCQGDSPTKVVTKALNAAKGASTFDNFSSYVAEDNDIKMLEDNTVDVSGSVGSAELTEVQQALMTAFAQKTLDFEFTTGEEKIDGDTATVAVSFSAYDTGTAFKNAFGEWFGEALTRAFAAAFGGPEMDENEMGALFYDKLQANMDKVTERTFTGDGVITLKKVDKDWKISSIDEDGQNAMTGNLFYAMRDLSDQMGKIGN